MGGVYASRTLPGTVTVALEVGPAEAEYSTTVCGGPIVAYSDAQCTYDKAIANRLMDIADGLGLDPQPAVLGAFESDASHAVASGLAARGGPAVPSHLEHPRLRGDPQGGHSGHVRRPRRVPAAPAPKRESAGIADAALTTAPEQQSGGEQCRAQPEVQPVVGGVDRHEVGRRVGCDHQPVDP